MRIIYTLYFYSNLSNRKTKNIFFYADTTKSFHARPKTNRSTYFFIRFFLYPTTDYPLIVQLSRNVNGTLTYLPITPQSSSSASSFPYPRYPQVIVPPRHCITLTPILVSFRKEKNSLRADSHFSIKIKKPSRVAHNRAPYVHLGKKSGPQITLRASSHQRHSSSIIIIYAGPTVSSRKSCARVATPPAKWYTARGMSLTRGSDNVLFVPCEIGRAHV